VKGENTLGAFPGVNTGEFGSQKLLENDVSFVIASAGGVMTGKQVVHGMGASWVQSTVVGPCISQKWAREILQRSQSAAHG
jgi:hypothetical protein